MQDDYEAQVLTDALHRFTLDKSDCWSERMKEESDNLSICCRIVKQMKATVRIRIRHELCAPYNTLVRVLSMTASARCIICQAT